MNARRSKHGKGSLGSRYPPWTLWVGLAGILLAQVLLGIDASARGWVTVPKVQPDQLPQPNGWLEYAGRYVAVNMTPLCWVAYLLVLEGILATMDRRRRALPGQAGRGGSNLSPIRNRPNRLIIAWLTSIPVWAVFDTLNFYYFDAWRYHGLPETFASRLVGYFIAFAAISPGMFLSGQLIQSLGVGKLVIRSPSRAQYVAWLAILGPAAIVVGLTLTLMGFEAGQLGRITAIVGSALLLVGPGLASFIRNRTRMATSLAIGLGFTLWAVLVRDAIACMTLWVGLIYLLDPLVAALATDHRRSPSLIRDWEAGRWGRTLALMAGGALCGLLWEFWNYWAIAKWTYQLPFLGQTQQWSYFEMPVLGFFGFLPFACECWVMLNLIIALFDRAHLHIVEPLVDDRAVM